MNRSVNDNVASPDRELLNILRQLDRTAIPLAAFRCYAAVSQDTTAIFVCPMLSDGSPEMDKDSGHMSWSQVTAPGPEFVRVVDTHFHVGFKAVATAG